MLELLSSGLEIVELLLLRSGEGEIYQRVRNEAESRGIPVRFSDRFDFDRKFSGTRHQGVAASYIQPRRTTLEVLVAQSKAASVPVVVLDGVEDPQNLGAVVRSSEVFGAAGVVIPSRRAAGLTPAAIKASAGAALRLPVVAAVNLAQALRYIKNEEIQVVGFDSLAPGSLFQSSLPDSVCLVFGSEGRGLARLTRELCDRLLKIPQAGRIGSLNVSAAAAVVLSELLRRKSEKPSHNVDLTRRY